MISPPDILDFFHVYCGFIVKKFLKYIDKDLITRLFLTQLEKVIIFRYKQTFFVTNGGLQLNVMIQLERVLIFVKNTHFPLLGVSTDL